MELRTPYLTKTTEESPAVQMSLTPAEQRLIWRLRQLIKEQYQGTIITFEGSGFNLSKLSRQERIGDKLT
jgi:hypothetical protein